MLKYPFEQTPESGELQEIAPGVQWLRMPLPMELDHINLYLLEDTDGWWVIDTGIAIDPTQALWEGVFANSLQGKPIKAVLATHYHPDHVGMAGWLCERWQCPFYITNGEYFTGLSFSRTLKEHFSWTVERHMQRSGQTAEQIEDARENWGGFGPYIKPMPTAYRRLVDGMTLTINGTAWQIVVGSGHSPEHACLYSAERKILISGDQVIPRITSNVSVNATEPEGNPLKDWLQSHERFLEVLPGDTLVLPAHNTPFFGLHERLRYLIDHHEDHLLALEQACVDSACTAMELLPVLFKRELKEHHIGLAVGECVAHLNYLFHRGQLERSLNAAGQFCYRSVDDTLPHRVRKQAHAPDSSTPVQV